MSRLGSGYAVAEGGDAVAGLAAPSKFCVRPPSATGTTAFVTTKVWEMAAKKGLGILGFSAGGHLAATAVQGLKPERVSIVDEAGRLLADGAASDSPGVSVAERQVAYERRLRDQMQEPRGKAQRLHFFLTLRFHIDMLRAAQQWTDEALEQLAGEESPRVRRATGD